MRLGLSTLVLVPILAACAAPQELELPEPSLPFPRWEVSDALIFTGSNCPRLSGKFLEPPKSSKPNNESGANGKKEVGSYYGRFPFHLAKRHEKSKDEIDLPANQFLIRQPDAANFFFLFLTHADTIVEYHFQAEEGDFECRNGYLEFPTESSFGMLEGRSVNFQLRKVVSRDNSGALIIEETMGPYRGNPKSEKSEFTSVFFRYSEAK